MEILINIPMTMFKKIPEATVINQYLNCIIESLRLYSINMAIPNILKLNYYS